MSTPSEKIYDLRSTHDDIRHRFVSLESSFRFVTGHRHHRPNATSMELSKHRDDRVALKEELSLLTAQFQKVNGKYDRAARLSKELPASKHIKKALAIIAYREGALEIVRSAVKAQRTRANELSCRQRCRRSTRLGHQRLQRCSLAQRKRKSAGGKRRRHGNAELADSQPQRKGNASTHRQIE
ncbi:hypothetical protein RI054_15g71660 [Pseudoscourfieldia marina]